MVPVLVLIVSPLQNLAPVPAVWTQLAADRACDISAIVSSCRASCCSVLIMVH